jgi:hypothetical protein
MRLPKSLIAEALELPCGARFYRTALQVNPYEYIVRFKKLSKYNNEADYNRAIVDACKNSGIEVIAITDHYRVQGSESLASMARDAGIKVFPGFEAVTKDGVHFLCLFDLGKSSQELERILGDCGIHRDDNESPTGRYDSIELVKEATECWGAVCLAAHVTGNGGLLNKLSGQSRINAWNYSYLIACSIPGPVMEEAEGVRQILENKDPAYKRERPAAIVNAQDVNGPEDLLRSGSSCWIKMSEVSLEGLRQAFLDPISRIRLFSDPAPEDHPELLAMTWEGGFLDGTAIHFNESLNVLIGGRGTGKSTVIESLRYVLGLEPLGEDARKAHEGIVRHVLRSGTKISVMVRSHRPTKSHYFIERTIPNPPVVRDEKGEVLDIQPSDVIPQVEVYGQHEISELTKSREKLTFLLERFVEHDAGLMRRKSDLRRELERSRARIVDALKEQDRIQERLASLSGLEETLRRFQEAGLEERLREQSLLVREESILKTAIERLSPFRDWIQTGESQVPIDRGFLSSRALLDLPGRNILREADSILEDLNKDIAAIIGNLKTILDQAQNRMEEVASRWHQRKSLVEEEYQKILRELQKSKIDGEEFIRLRQQIEELRPLKDQEAALIREHRERANQRRNLLAEWENLKAEEFRGLQRAAKLVSNELTRNVWVQVTPEGNRETLLQLFRDQIGGRLSETLDGLKQQDDLSLRVLADSCREGKDALNRKFKIPVGQAERILEGREQFFMQIEELDLAPTTTIKLNVAPEGEPPEWQALEDLSTGQKATAVLLLLLLESKAPLIVDQPEDDLDNRFITDSVVPRMREEKRRRQFVFATHNANIPVLGDAELILGLTASGEAAQGQAKLPVEYMGSIDTRSVRELVEEVLEGGKVAFEMRRLKYGF